MPANNYVKSGSHDVYPYDDTSATERDAARAWANARRADGYRISEWRIVLGFVNGGQIAPATWNSKSVSIELAPEPASEPKPVVCRLASVIRASKAVRLFGGG